MKTTVLQGHTFVRTNGMKKLDESGKRANEKNVMKTAKNGVKNEMKAAKKNWMKTRCENGEKKQPTKLMKTSKTG